MVRWGILGAGKIAHTFVSDLAYVSDAVLQAVASRSLESATEFALRYAIPTAHGSYEDLYNDPEVDAIYIATPHNFHLQQTLASIKANKSVLCEKPITVNPNQCLELIQNMRKSENSVMEAMWTYFLPAIHKAEEWVKQGRIGKVKHIKYSRILVYIVEDGLPAVVKNLIAKDNRSGTTPKSKVNTILANMSRD